MTILSIMVLIIVAIVVHDLTQKKHSLLRIYPLVGRFRFFSEWISPKIHQYLESNHSGRPFPKSWRRWIYAAAKKQNINEGFGTDKNLKDKEHFFLLPEFFPNKEIPVTSIKAKKIIGSRRAKPYRPEIINISGMSFGALSGAAVRAMNVGAKISGSYQVTGEGGLSEYHLHGADVVFQFGTGYNGVATEVIPEKGKTWVRTLDIDKLKDLCAANPCIKMVEIKLHQGAKPGAWSILPASKMTREIANVRGVQFGSDSVSPAHHEAFSNIEELVELIERIAEVTGLPVGIKCAVGKLVQWHNLAEVMKRTGKGPDYIIIDGGEGGTGSATNSFVDHMGLPFEKAFSEVYKIFQNAGIEKNVFWIGSGKLGLAANVIKAMGMGCDSINVAREMMMSIGCIQSQLCHTNSCPTGIATQNKFRQRAIDVEDKGMRAGQFLNELKREVSKLTHAAGYSHPSEFNTSDITVNTSTDLVSLEKLLGYRKS